jgi:hypothetical protein
MEFHCTLWERSFQGGLGARSYNSELFVDIRALGQIVDVPDMDIVYRLILEGLT